MFFSAFDINNLFILINDHCKTTNYTTYNSVSLRQCLFEMLSSNSSEYILRLFFTIILLLMLNKSQSFVCGIMLYAAGRTVKVVGVSIFSGLPCSS